MKSETVKNKTKTNLSTWRKVSLIDCIDLIGGGTPKTSVTEYWDGNIPWLSVKDFNNDNRYVYTTEKHISEKGLANSSTKLLQKDDIIISARGTVGELAMIPFPMAFNQSCYGIRAKAGIDKTFLYYLLKNIIKQLKAVAYGSVFDTITRDTFSNIFVNIPDEGSQGYIASILSAFDDKIALNNKINENLEQQAQALHQNYFDGIDRKGQLSDLCSFSKNKIAVSELDANNYFSTENMLSDKKGATKATNLPGIQQTTACHIGDVLVSNIRPYFKKILYCHNEGGCSTDVLCFVPKKPELSVYLYCILYADEFFDFMVAGSKGTKMPRGDKQQIMTYSIYSPSDTELKEFNAQVLTVLKMIENNRNENEKLKLVRDLILPKLINGEIELN